MGDDSPSTTINPLIMTVSDLNGGAARAAYRLHQGLLQLEVPSRMLVHKKTSGDRSVAVETSWGSKMSPTMNRLPLNLYPDRRTGVFSPQWFANGMERTVARLKPNIISLHWIGNGYLKIETLARFNLPLVWTLHDFWVFTGGCHYPPQCDRYTEKCGKCNYLSSQSERDLSRWVWQRKAKTYPQLNLTLIAPSQWLAAAARRSSLCRHLPIEVIPHGLNTDIYQPVEQHIARKLLNLPQNKYFILFAADSGSFFDPRKGLDLLCLALQKLPQGVLDKPLELLFLGVNSAPKVADIGCQGRYLGKFHDDLSLALVYSAADVTVVSSVQEAFGQTASESLACGTPVVAFKDTGVTEIVEHMKDGYLARPFAAEDLAAGIKWILEDGDRYQKLRRAARCSALQKFTLQLQAQRYLSIFDNILTQSRSFQLNML